MPVASQTAWQGIFTHGHLEKGQTILIHGGAGAVGAYSVQLASHAGAIVIATASGDDEAYLNVITAQTTLLSNQQTAVTLRRQQMTSSVQLVEALGGGWSVSDLPTPQDVAAPIEQALAER